MRVDSESSRRWKGLDWSAVTVVVCLVINLMLVAKWTGSVDSRVLAQEKKNDEQDQVNRQKFQEQDHRFAKYEDHLNKIEEKFATKQDINDLKDRQAILRDRMCRDGDEIKAMIRAMDGKFDRHTEAVHGGRK